MAKIALLFKRGLCEKTLYNNNNNNNNSGNNNYNNWNTLASQNH